MAGRPDLMADRTTLTLAEGMTGMMENVFINVKNKSLTITAEVEVPKGGANGAILVQGGRFGGWALYVKDGRAGLRLQLPRPAAQQRRIETAAAGRQGHHPAGVRLRWRRPRQGWHRHAVRERRAGRPGANRADAATVFSADETADVGIDLGTPVVEAIGAEAKSRFTGRIPKVTVEVK